jgi:hypothetical protein
MFTSMAQAAWIRVLVMAVGHVDFGCVKHRSNNVGICRDGKRFSCAETVPVADDETRSLNEWEEPEDMKFALS